MTWAEFYFVQSEIGCVEAAPAPQKKEVKEKEEEENDGTDSTP